MSFTFNATASSWPTSSARVRVVVVDGIIGASRAAPSPGIAIPHSSGGRSTDAPAAILTAGAAEAVATAEEPAVDYATLEHQPPYGKRSSMNELDSRHAVMAVHQQQPEPPAQNRHIQPLPWRALHHLGSAGSQDQANVSSSQAPAYLVSAFLDTRPIMHGQRARIAVILAIDKRTSPQGWKCLLRFSSSGAYPQLLGLTVAHSVGNNEAFFNYRASTAFCELPQALQEKLLPSNSSNKSGAQANMSLTVIQDSGEGRSFSESLLSKPQVWVLVEIVPVLAAKQRQSYMSGEGSVAVCSPPVHTDAYAATLVGWQAFHKIMGVQHILMYSFNPGPLIKPLMDFYAAQGFVQLHEWIIPASILEHKQQVCLLPFFHSSEHRAKFDSPPCTYHQDNYAIAHWGQALAIQDCVYRAMAAKHRWVAVLDLDEYILPKAAHDWHAMLQQLVSSNSGKAAVEYIFPGVRMCSGCHQQQQQALHQTNRTWPQACRPPPTIGFHHITWPSTLLAASGNGRDGSKAIVDPLAVGQASAHTIAEVSPHSLATGRTEVPNQVAVKLHDRVHDIHKGNTTFAARMLPLLKNNIGQVAAATAAGKFDQQALPLWPSPGSACEVCGSVSRAELGSPSLQSDLAFCTLFGQRLHNQIRADVAAMVEVGLFNDTSAWGSTAPLIANLYGGHSFDAWAPP